MCFYASTAMEFEPVQEKEAGGIVLLMNHHYHLRMEYGMFEGTREIRLTRCFGGQDQLIARAPWEKKILYLKVTADYQKFDFYFSEDNENWIALATQTDGTLLSREVAGGYTGTVLGLYASSNGSESRNYADFDWFEYRESFH